MGYRIGTSSFYGTNEISNFNGMDASGQANAIQSIANTSAIVNMFESNHKEMLAQNESNHKDTIKELNTQNVIAAAQVRETMELASLTEDVLYETRLVGDILSDFSLNNLELLGSIDDTLMTSLKQLALINCGVDTIVELLKVPEFEKERIFYIKEAFKYLEMSLTIPERSVDALEYFLKANELNNRDVVVNYNIGLLKQHRSYTLDVVGAKTHLNQALEYVYNDKEFKSIILSELAYNSLGHGDINQTIKLCGEAFMCDSKNIDAILYYLDSALMKDDFDNGFQLLYSNVDLSAIMKAITLHMEQFVYTNMDEITPLNHAAHKLVKYCVVRLAKLQNRLIDEGLTNFFERNIIKDRVLGDKGINPLELHRVLELFREHYEPLDVNKNVYR